MVIFQVVLGGLFYYSFPYIFMAFYLILVTYYMAADDLIGSKKPLEPDVCMCKLSHSHCNSRLT